MMSDEATEGTAENRQKFLDFLAETGNITASAERARVHRRTVYKWKKDPVFLALFNDAYEQGMDALEDEANRRGREGVDRPVFYKGEVCGHVREYSDTLLMFMLNGGRPYKFRPPPAEKNPEAAKLSITITNDLGPVTDG